MRATLFLCLLCFATLQAQTIEDPISTPIDSWEPILPGQWRLTTARFDSAVRATPNTKGIPPPSTQETISACPFPGPYLLRRHSALKLGVSGCHFRVYRLSNNLFHIVALCRTLSGKDHQELSTLAVSPDRKSFSLAASWQENGRAFTVRQEAVWLAPCGKDQ